MRWLSGSLEDVDELEQSMQDAEFDALLFGGGDQKATTPKTKPKKHPLPNGEGGGSTAKKPKKPSKKTQNGHHDAMDGLGRADMVPMKKKSVSG